MNSFRKLDFGFLLGAAVGLLVVYSQLGHADMVSVLSPSDAGQCHYRRDCKPVA
jgi:hypothetical protein